MRLRPTPLAAYADSATDALLEPPLGSPEAMVRFEASNAAWRVLCGCTFRCFACEDGTVTIGEHVNGYLHVRHCPHCGTAYILPFSLETDVVMLRNGGRQFLAQQLIPFARLLLRLHHAPTPRVHLEMEESGMEEAVVQEEQDREHTEGGQPV